MKSEFQLYKPLAAVSLFSIPSMLLFIAVFTAAGGLVFTLDDAYIHMAVARSISNGWYGINPGEYGSPSSSILWPVLLLPGIWLDQVAGWTFLLGFGSVVLVTVVTWNLLDELMPGLRPVRGAAMVLAYLLLINGFALPYMGMEHTVQVLLSLLVAKGIHDLFTSGDCLLVVAAAGFAPLIRYESLSVTLIAAAALLYKGKRMQAVLLLVSTAAALGAFSLFLYSLGLPLLPNSVLVKTGLAVSPVQWVIAANPLAGFHSRFGMFLLPFHLSALAVSLYFAVKTRESSRFYSISTATVIVLHLLAGKYGGYGRYEVYLNAFIIPSLFSVWQRNRDLVSGKKTVVFAAALALAGTPYGYASITTPKAAADMFFQQRQMASFAAHWATGVAANDIGMLAFYSGKYVMDMYGLNTGAYSPAKIAAHPGVFEAALREKGITLIMVYDSWFPSLPAGLIRAGKLQLKHPAVFIGREVSFYTFPHSLPKLRSAMVEFAHRLPDGCRFVYE